MLRLSMLSFLLPLVACSAFASDATQKLPVELKPEDTEQWSPQPALVNFSERGVPSDAEVLFDKDNLNQWRKVNDNSAAEWTVGDGYFQVKPGTGDIKSVASYCDVQVHIEWASTKEDKNKRGQNKSNSGIFLQSRYEIQILDSFQNKTYANGQAASVYKQSRPLMNASLPVGEWQSYDIVFRAPRFDKGALVSEASITVLHNGVLAQDKVLLEGATRWKGKPSYDAHGCAPIVLQDHGSKVRFRNIWVRKLGE